MNRKCIRQLWRDFCVLKRMKHSVALYHFILSRSCISRKTMTAFCQWLLIFLSQPEKPDLLNFTDLSETHITVRRIIKKHCPILKNIQQEQRQADVRINMSWVIVIIKPARLIKQLKYFLK